MSIITLQEGQEMISRYKVNRPTMLSAGYEEDILTLNETFTKEEIIDILDQSGCDKLRCHFGMDKDFNIKLIIVGVDNQENDMLEIIVEKGVRCPFVCPPDSALTNP